MIIEGFKPFVGQHCETTTAGALLYQLDIDLSEAMLFGLGEGLSFIFWHMKIMDFPFIGGRVKPDLLTENLCRNLNLQLVVKETTSAKKAWSNVETHLKEGKAVGLKLDCYHLEYFSNKIHFAGHYVAMYGYNKDFALLVDTQQQGCEVKTSLENLALARSEKGPMSSRNRSFTISKVGAVTDLKSAVRQAIGNNANAYLNPPIKNLNYKGIKKTATEIKKWFQQSNDIKSEFQLQARLMEKAGTGGGLFRNLYRDFLKESAELLSDENIYSVWKDFKNIAQQWTEVSTLFDKVGETSDEKYLTETAKILLDLSEKERSAMQKLI